MNVRRVVIAVVLLTFVRAAGAQSIFGSIVATARDQSALAVPGATITLEAQMQQKMAAQHQAQQAEYELQKQEMLAKAAVAKAEGEAARPQQRQGRYTMSTSA